MPDFYDPFLPGESLGMPEKQKPVGRFLRGLLGRDYADLSQYGTPPFNPSAPVPLPTSPKSPGGIAGTTAPKQPGHSKLEKLLAFVLPAASGFIAAQRGRRRDRTRNFLAGVTGGAVNVLQGEVARRARTRLELKEAAEKAVTERRAGEKHTTDIAQTQQQTSESRAREGQIGKAKPELEYVEVQNQDGSTARLEREKGSGKPFVPSMREVTERLGTEPLIGELFGAEQRRRGTGFRERVPVVSAPKPEELKTFLTTDESRERVLIDSKTGKIVSRTGLRAPMGTKKPRVYELTQEQLRTAEGLATQSFSEARGNVEAALARVEEGIRQGMIDPAIAPRIRKGIRERAAKPGRGSNRERLRGLVQPR